MDWHYRNNRRKVARGITSDARPGKATPRRLGSGIFTIDYSLRTRAHCHPGGLQCEWPGDAAPDATGQADQMIHELDEQTFVAEFFDLMGEVECGDRFDPTSPSHVQWLKDRIHLRFAAGARFFAIYLDDGTPVGFTAVVADPKLEGVPYLGQYSEVVAIGVAAKHRRRGHGSRLLEYSERHARHIGLVHRKHR